jgi:hypothetical protein
MLRRVALVRTDVLEELSSSMIRATRIGQLGTFAVTSNRAFPVNLFLSPWWWRRYVPPKRRFLQESHGVTFQKTRFSNEINLYSEVSFCRWCWIRSKAPITEAIYWPIVPALDDRWRWLRSNLWNDWVAEETDILRENMSQCRSVHHRFHMTCPGIEPGPMRWEVGLKQL